MKVIFLDIDGVMIPLGEEYRQRSTRSYKGGGSLMMDFDPVCADNLRKILNNTGAMIVVSSSWRHNMEDVKKSFLDVGLDWNLVISKTPSSLGHGRGNEILTWLNEYHETCKDGFHVSHWVALDDDNMDMKSLSRLKRFIHTDGNTGLTITDVIDAIEILNKFPHQ